MKLIDFIFIINISYASIQIPAVSQNDPVLLRGATIHTISNGIIYNADLLFDSGKIIDLGKYITKTPYNTKIIDLNGKNIYPGLISAISTMGLQEIGSIRATRDYAETGDMNPNVRANVSYNPDSELIPVTRSNGVLLALSVPRSGLISGVSSLMMLDGWTWEDATFKHPMGLHIFWPSMNIPKLNKEKKKKSNDESSYIKSIQKINDIFEKSHAYLKLKVSKSTSFYHDSKLEGMLPVLKGEIPIFIHANEIRQIEAAIYWADLQNIDMVLVGGKDAWRNTDLLVKKDIPVIYTQTFSTPMRRFESYDQAFITPNLLYAAGVKFCISNSESPFQTPHVRNLPYYAAKAGSYGLPWEEALRSITLSAAEILGIDDLVGSIEIGKNATFIITDGDILDIRSHVLEAYIQGRKIDLSDRHKNLFSKYKQKYIQQGLLKEN